MDVSAATGWWVAAGIAVAAELGTGTFYLLMIALGLAAAAVAAHLGLPAARADGRRGASSAAAPRPAGTGTAGAAAARDSAAAPEPRRQPRHRRARPRRRLGRRRHGAGPATAARGWTARLAPGAPAAAGRARRLRRRGQLARARARFVRSLLTTGSQSMEVALVIAVIAAIFIFQTFKIVPQQHAWVVERLGKYDRTLTPGLKLRRALHRARRLQALAQGSAARRAEPGLHHARQHPAAGRRHHLLPGHRPDARELRLEQLHRRRSRSWRRRCCAR